MLFGNASGVTLTHRSGGGGAGGGGCLESAAEVTDADLAWDLNQPIRIRRLEGGYLELRSGGGAAVKFKALSSFDVLIGLQNCVLEAEVEGAA